MEFQYQLENAQIFSGDGLIFYGISGTDGLSVRQINQISTDRVMLEALVQKLNAEQVPLIHFYDIVEDALIDSMTIWP